MKLKFLLSLLTLSTRFLKEFQCKILGDKDEVEFGEKLERSPGVIIFLIELVEETPTKKGLTS